MNFFDIDYKIFPESVLKEVQKRGGFVTKDFSNNFFNPADYYYWHNFFRQMLIYAEDKLYTVSKRKIAFFIYKDEEISAFSLTDGEKQQYDFIGISYRTIVCLKDLFYRILSNPNCFPDIGNADLENAERTYLDYISCQNISLNSPVPFDPVRQAYAECLLKTALVFIIGHEITHLRHGHIDFLMKYPLRKSDNSLYQTFEMDADGGATVLAMIFCMNRRDDLFLRRNIVKPEIEQAYFHAFRDVLLCMKTLSFSVSCIYKINGNVKWMPQLLPGSRHPQNIFRQYSIRGNLMSLVEDRPNEYPHTIEETSGVVASSFRLAELYFSKITKSSPNYDDLRSIIGNKHTEKAFWNVINDYKVLWKEIYYELDNIKRGGSLPTRPD